jgi:hypothetical protein
MQSMSTEGDHQEEQGEQEGRRGLIARRAHGLIVGSLRKQGGCRADPLPENIGPLGGHGCKAKFGSGPVSVHDRVRYWPPLWLVLTCSYSGCMSLI